MVSTEFRKHEEKSPEEKQILQFYGLWRGPLRVIGEGQLEAKWVHESPYKLVATFNEEKDRKAIRGLKRFFLKHVVDTGEIPGLPSDAVKVINKGDGFSHIVISGQANIERFVELNQDSTSLRRIYGCDSKNVSSYEFKL